MLFGDVVGSRRDPTHVAAWLRDLTGRLRRSSTGTRRSRRSGSRRATSSRGLGAPSADPLRAVLLGALDDDAPQLRWVAVAGEIAAGSGPAPERNGQAFVAAREAIDRARRQRDRLLMLTGDAVADVLLDDLAPVLGELLDELTDRQRTVARPGARGPASAVGGRASPERQSRDDLGDVRARPGRIDRRPGARHRADLRRRSGARGSDPRRGRPMTAAARGGAAT